MSFQSTPWQTVGPYYRLGLEPLYRTDIARLPRAVSAWKCRARCSMAMACPCPMQ